MWSPGAIRSFMDLAFTDRVVFAFDLRIAAIDARAVPDSIKVDAELLDHYITDPDAIEFVAAGTFIIDLDAIHLWITAVDVLAVPGAHEVETFVLVQHLAEQTSVGVFVAAGTTMTLGFITLHERVGAGCSVTVVEAVLCVAVLGSKDVAGHCAVILGNAACSRLLCRFAFHERIGA